MKKCYYFVCRCDGLFTSSVSEYEGEFDILDATEWLKKRYDNVVIINWKEISSTQFAKLYNYYTKSKK